MSARPLRDLMDDVTTTTCPSLNILVVCEDADARTRVHEVYESLEQQFSKVFCFGSTWCDFEGLKDSHVAADSARAAAEADLILFSANAHTEPPDTVKAWVESWIHRKLPHESALGGLLNRTEAGDGKGMPAQAYLTDVARRGRMDPIFEIVCAPPKPIASVSTEAQEKVIPLYQKTWNDSSGPLSESWPD